MTIYDFIKTNKLSLYREFTPADAGFIHSELIGPGEHHLHDNRFQFYANEEWTLFASLNLTTGDFRILYSAGLAILKTEWLRVVQSYSEPPPVEKPRQSPRQK